VCRCKRDGEGGGEREEEEMWREEKTVEMVTLGGDKDVLLKRE
jgi:hypothetical protein